MGNTLENSSDSFISRYVLIGCFEDKNFGNIEAYRKKEENYDYVMLIHKYPNQDSYPKLKKELQLLNRMLVQTQQTLFLKLFKYEEQYSCGTPKITIFMEYLNYTLWELFEKRRNQGNYFNYQQIMHILNSILEAYDLIKIISPTSFSCLPKWIFLTPQGYIKFCPFSIHHFQSIQPICPQSCRIAPKRQCQREAQQQLIDGIKITMRTLLQVNQNAQDTTQINILESQKAKQLCKNVLRAKALSNIRKHSHQVFIDSLQICKEEVDCYQNWTEDSRNNKVLLKHTWASRTRESQTNS